MNVVLKSIWQLMYQVRTVTLMLVLPCLLGCMHEEDEEHHLEHLIPAHKPADFSDCVEQLELRGKRFFSDELTESEGVELSDIINWLPELAADSDLKREQWEQVQAITTKLEKIAEQPPTSAASEHWTKQVAALEELIPFADRFNTESNLAEQVPGGIDEDRSNND